MPEVDGSGEADEADVGPEVQPGVEPETDPPEQEQEQEPPALEESPPPPPRFTRPDSIRGIYLTAWSAGSAARSEALIDLAGETELNTFVIDIKDASGFVSHRTGVEMARDLGADGEIRIGDLPGLLRRLKEADIYPVARIVVFKDHLLPETRPDLALRETGAVTAAGEDPGPAGPAEDADGNHDDELPEAFWRDGGGHPWSSPRSREVWDYHVELAREVAEMGFPEIQWDYVRFPDVPGSVQEALVIPGTEEGPRAQVIRRFLAHTREELSDLDVRVTADVFGVAATARTDVGIGQRWEDFIDVVDAALPMIYPSHYWEGSFGLDSPNAYPYEVIWESLGQATVRSAAVEGAGEVIPWLQDFSLGSPRYEAPEVRAQIQATYDRGIPHWVLWNPGSRYTRDALAPAEGFPEGHDPLIRLGGRIMPASQRLATPLGDGAEPPPTLLEEAGVDGWRPPWDRALLSQTLPPRWRITSDPGR